MKNGVYLGDCLELMKDVPEDAFFISDPPYNQKYHYSTYGDNLSTSEYCELLWGAFKGKKAVVILYPEETVNLLGGGVMGGGTTGCFLGLQFQHRKAISPHFVVQLQT